jgi:K+-transporting ATPase KdpF subunit
MNPVIMTLLATKVSSAGYLAGGIIAFLILAYLIYVLIKPDKF